MNERAGKIVITDDAGREHAFGSPARRVVSLVPSLTETFALLAGADRLAGITRYCIHPQEALRGIPRIGGTKDPDIDKILSLAPDVVIANEEENLARHVEALDKSVPVFVTFPRSVRQTIKTVRDLGVITGATDNAEQFAQSCEAVLKAIEADASIANPLRTACMIWKEPWMCAGPDTYVSNVLEVLGFENIFDSSQERYFKTTLDEVIARTPQLILLPDEPYEFEEGDKALVLDHLKSHAANARVELIEGSNLTWFGSRTLPALGYLRKFKKTLLKS
jgi:ABC-type Fe3+-hydroxamate transport system substrate-binding protein